MLFQIGCCKGLILADPIWTMRFFLWMLQGVEYIWKSLHYVLCLGGSKIIISLELKPLNHDIRLEFCSSLISHSSQRKSSARLISKESMTAIPCNLAWTLTRIYHLHVWNSNFNEWLVKFHHSVFIFEGLYSQRNLVFVGPCFSSNLCTQKKLHKEQVGCGIFTISYYPLSFFAMYSFPKRRTWWSSAIASTPIGWKIVPQPWPWRSMQRWVTTLPRRWRPTAWWSRCRRMGICSWRAYFKRKMKGKKTPENLKWWMEMNGHLRC